MTKYELTKLAASLLTTAKANKVTTADVEKLPIFEDYQRLCAEGHKITAIMYYLSEHYGVCESKLYAYFAKMKSDVEM